MFNFSGAPRWFRFFFSLAEDHKQKGLEVGLLFQVGFDHNINTALFLACIHFHFPLHNFLILLDGFPYACAERNRKILWHQFQQVEVEIAVRETDKVLEGSNGLLHFKILINEDPGKLVFV